LHPKSAGGFPDVCNPLQCSVLQRITVLPPVITHHFGQQLAVICLQGLTEQTAAVEGMFSQHALAPAVDSGDGRLVHPLRCQLEAAGALVPLRLREIPAQLTQQLVTLSIAAEYACGLDQTRTNPVAQFTRGRIGERHHQDLWRQQCLAKRSISSMAEDQAQVKCGNGEGLARAGTGLDQTTAVQGERQGQRSLLTHAATSSSACGWLSSSGW